MSTVNTGREALEKTFAHYGVKGMHWGVRKGESGAPAHVRKIKQRPLLKTKVATRGGRAQPATADAVSARLLQQTFKKSGKNALTNEELRVLQDRLNLETNVARLSGRNKNEGQKWAEQELKKHGSAKVASLVAKKAAVAAVAA